LFFEAEFFIIICKQKSWIKRFFLFKSAQIFCWDLMDFRWGLMVK